MAQIAGILLLLFLLLVGWIFVRTMEWISDASSSHKKGVEFKKEREEKYSQRPLDSSKDLYDRNIDLITAFGDQVETVSYRSYYIENLTRDCLNEICLAENRSDMRPDHAYLSRWKYTAPTEWVELAARIEGVLQNRREELRSAEDVISRTRNQLQQIASQRVDPKSMRKVKKHGASRNIILDDIASVLTPSAQAWESREDELVEGKGELKPLPQVSLSASAEKAEGLNREIDAYNSSIDADFILHKENRAYFKTLKEDFKTGSKDAVLRRLDLIMDWIDVPASFPKEWDVDFDSAESIAIIEIALPDVVHTQTFKKIEQKSGVVNKPITQKEAKEYLPKVHPAMMLRVAYEVFRNDQSGIIKLLVLNGWVEFHDPATGNQTKVYTASLVVERDQVVNLNLERLEPVSAFLNLKGKSAGKLIDIIPVTPSMTLNTKDKRFIATKEVLDNLSTETNLALMDWQDFESLIAELFQKEFADKGAEVKVTQASRDRGVDAVVFDPDPIKGGKYIIQAKRYTNTVDVSAVRDLCAVVKKEGASKGILVTTSAFGPDAYTFAQNEPVTLLNGAELLGLLAKHDYKFRINLAEARKVMKS